MMNLKEIKIPIPNSEQIYVTIWNNLLYIAIKNKLYYLNQINQLILVYEFSNYENISSWNSWNELLILTTNNGNIYKITSPHPTKPVLLITIKDINTDTNIANSIVWNNNLFIVTWWKTQETHYYSLNLNNELSEKSGPKLVSTIKVW
jgi:hypothetical protein